MMRPNQVSPCGQQGLTFRSAQRTDSALPPAGKEALADRLPCRCQRQRQSQRLHPRSANAGAQETLHAWPAAMPCNRSHQKCGPEDAEDASRIADRELNMALARHTCTWIHQIAFREGTAHTVVAPGGDPQSELNDRAVKPAGFSVRSANVDRQVDPAFDQAVSEDAVGSGELVRVQGIGEVKAVTQLNQGPNYRGLLELAARKAPRPILPELPEVHASRQPVVVVVTRPKWLAAQQPVGSRCIATVVPKNPSVVLHKRKYAHGRPCSQPSERVELPCCVQRERGAHCGCRQAFSMSQPLSTPDYQVRAFPDGAGIRRPRCGGPIEAERAALRARATRPDTSERLTAPSGTGRDCGTRTLVNATVRQRN